MKKKNLMKKIYNKDVKNRINGISVSMIFKSTSSNIIFFA